MIFRHRGLRSKETGERVAAARELGSSGDQRAVKPLIAALGDQDWSVREAAARALGELGDARAVQPLIPALGDRDEDWRVREAAARALGELGDARAVQPLIKALGSVHPQVRGVAADALVKFGEAAVQPLIAALWDEDWRAREAAARALGELGDARAVQPLIAALRSVHPEVRGVAADALGKLGEAAVQPLIAALRNKDRSVCEAAARALGELGDARAVQPLIAALGSAYSKVRDAAADALDKLGERPKDDSQRAQRAIATRAWHEVVALGSAAVEPLIAALGGKESGAAARALGELGDARAVQPLIAALAYNDWNVRRGAANALGQLGGALAVEPLIAALGDQDWGVREAAARALGKLGDARAVQPLIAALADQDSTVREAAARELGKLGDARAVQPLIAALADQDSTVREAAARELGKLGDARAVQSLIAALGDKERGVREAAARALGELGDARAVQPLIAALADENPRVREAAADALGELGWRPENDSQRAQRAIAARAWGELVDLGSAAVEPLIAVLVFRHAYDAEPWEACLIQPLRSALERSLPSIDADVLRQVTALEDIQWYVHHTSSCKGLSFESASTKTHSLADVRQLARQELIRRSEIGAPSPSGAPVTSQEMEMGNSEKKRGARNSRTSIGPSATDDERWLNRVWHVGEARGSHGAERAPLTPVRQPKPLQVNLGDVQDFTLESIAENDSPMMIVQETKSNMVTPDVARQALQAKHHEHRADELAQLRRFPEAAEEYKRAIEIAPYEDEILYMSLGGVLSEIREPTEALHYLEIASELNPTNEDVARNLRICEYELARRVDFSRRVVRRRR